MGKTQRRILLLLRGGQRLTSRSIAAALSLERHTVYNSLARLQTLGSVLKELDDGVHYYRLAPDINPLTKKETHAMRKLVTILKNMGSDPNSQIVVRILQRDYDI